MAEGDTSIEELALAGVGWSLSRVIAESAAKLAIGIILARLLLPRDFGLTAIVMLVNGAAGLIFSAGLWASIIRTRDLSRDELRVALTMSMFLGVLAFVAVWFAAPHAASFFQNPAIVPLLRAAAIELIFLGFASVVRSLRIRRLDLKAVVFSETIGTVLGYGLVGILLACLGAGAWSLVLGYLARSILVCLCLCLMERPPFKPLFRFSAARRLLGFGTGVTTTSVINFAAVKVDNLFVGRYLSPGDLGLYSKVFKLMQFPPSLFARIASEVLFSYMSEVQREKEKLAAAYLASLSCAALLCFPVLLSMAASARYVIVGLYGEEWSGAVDIFRILIVAGLFKTLLSVVGSVIKAMGLVHREALRQLLYLAILSCGGYVGVRFGTMGVAAAVVIGAIWSYWSVSRLVNSRLGISWGKVLMAQAPGLLVGCIVGGISWLSGLAIRLVFPVLPVPIMLLLIVTVSALGYLAAIIFLPAPLKGDSIALVARKLESRSLGVLNWLMKRLAS